MTVRRTLNDVNDVPARVRLVAVGPSSLDIEIFAYIKTNDKNAFLAVREDLYLEILRELENAGTALAPPAKIQYVESAKPVTPNVKESPGDQDGRPFSAG